MRVPRPPARITAFMLWPSLSDDDVLRVPIALEGIGRREKVLHRGRLAAPLVRLLDAPPVERPPPRLSLVPEPPVAMLIHQELQGVRRHAQPLAELRHVVGRLCFVCANQCQSFIAGDPSEANLPGGMVRDL